LQSTERRVLYQGPRLVSSQRFPTCPYSKGSGRIGTPEIAEPDRYLPAEGAERLISTLAWVTRTAILSGVSSIFAEYLQTKLDIDEEVHANALDIAGWYISRVKSRSLYRR